MSVGNPPAKTRVSPEVLERANWRARIEGRDLAKVLREFLETVYAPPGITEDQIRQELATAQRRAAMHALYPPETA